LRYDGDTGALHQAFPSRAPDGLAFGADGNLYVSSFSSDIIERYDCITGAFLGIFASGGGLEGPMGLAFGPDGDLYVSSTSTWNNSVLRYDGHTGAFVGTFASVGDPVGLAFGEGGDLYVSSLQANSVLRYDGGTGTFIGPFASGGGLDGPTYLIFTPEPTTLLLFGLGGLVLLRNRRA
jgi:DNA-binding beta-propeller fold protein YncE